MTSLQSHIKQLPSEVSYFRPVPALASSAAALPSTILTFTAGAGAPLRTVNISGVGANGSFSTAAWATAAPAFALLSSGQCVLKDMGRTVVSAGRTFRRVQMVVPDATFSATGGVGGAASGTDSDYMCGYIELGLNGNGAPSPFVRA
jgi:hypothetical protein